MDRFLSIRRLPTKKKNLSFEFSFQVEEVFKKKEKFTKKNNSFIHKHTVAMVIIILIL